MPAKHGRVEIVAVRSEFMDGLYVDPTIPRFTREELVVSLDQRFGFTDGAFRKWQEKGLVASPRHEHRWAKGRPGSGQGLWSDNDRRMLIAVLELRERHRIEVGRTPALANLANFIVWSWVYWDGYVALDQAQRALQSWVTPQLGGVGPGRARSKDRVSRQARQVVDRVAASGVPLQRRIRVAAKLSERLWADDPAGLRALVDDLATVMDPERTGRRLGAPGVSIDAAGEIDRLYLSHRGAQAVVTGLPAINDRDWQAARQTLQEGWADYQADQPSLAAAATAPDLFVEPTVSTQLAGCSASLLLVLGARSWSGAG